LNPVIVFKNLAAKQKQISELDEIAICDILVKCRNLTKQELRMNIFSKALGVVLIVLAIIVTCNRSAVDDKPDEDATDAVTVTEALVSECGGFTTEKAARAAGDSVETLTWQYNASSKTLRLHHTALRLNCCGIRIVDAWFNDGMIGIVENDQPAEDGGRCECLFDFNVTMTGVKQEPVEVSILLTVDSDTTEHWTGIIDLARGSGSVAIMNPPGGGGI
jgi:hypothetical protein